MTSIYVLGAGTPTPTAQRFGSSFVIKTEDNQIMLDCGPAATHKLVQAGLWPTDIDHLFLLIITLITILIIHVFFFAGGIKA